MIIKVIDPIPTGKRIKEKCEQAGFSVNYLKRILQLGSAQSIYKWYSDKSSSIPSLDHLVVLAMLLNCSIDDLLVLTEVQIEPDD